MTNFVPQVPDLDALLTHMFSDLQQHPNKAEGVGQLLFEMCKGVRKMFHSNTANVSLIPKDFDVQRGCAEYLLHVGQSFHLIQCSICIADIVSEI